MRARAFPPSTCLTPLSDSPAPTLAAHASRAGAGWDWRSFARLHGPTVERQRPRIAQAGARLSAWRSRSGADKSSHVGHMHMGHHEVSRTERHLGWHPLKEEDR
jgi:hypothetical protein